MFSNMVTAAVPSYEKCLLGAAYVCTRTAQEACLQSLMLCTRRTYMSTVLTTLGLPDRSLPPAAPLTQN